MPVMNRRTFLRSAGVCIGLPLLDAMIPPFVRADEKALRPRRMVLIGRGLGMHAPFFFPEKAGKDYEPSRHLKQIQEHREDFTVFSGMSHVGYNIGHTSELCLMTGVPAEFVRTGDIRNSISLDQEVASHVGGHTRYSSLVIGGGMLSWNRKGVQVPSEDQAGRVFKQLFIDGTPEEIAAQIKRIKFGKSVLDGVREQAKSLALSLSPADRTRLDLMLTSIREAEQRLQQDEEWVLKPKPKVSVKPYVDNDAISKRMLDREQRWFELVHLALQTDSTRVISLHCYSHQERLDIEGVELTHHDASHHGQDEKKIQQLGIIEEKEMKLFGELLSKLKSTDEGGKTLLDHTIVFHASNLGNASAHLNDNLPIILAGGGFKHAGHVAFDKKKNTQLSNLFLRMLRQMEIPAERFGASNAVLSEV